MGSHKKPIKNAGANDQVQGTNTQRYAFEKNVSVSCLVTTTMSGKQEVLTPEGHFQTESIGASLISIARK